MSQKNKILGLRTVIYKVSDITAAKQWYSKLFDQQPYFDEVFYVGFNIGGFELGLQPEEETDKKNDSVVAYWGVNDVDSTYQRFLEAGANEHEPPQNVGGDIIVATIKDPWNNVIGLIYNPDFKIE